LPTSDKGSDLIIIKEVAAEFADQEQEQVIYAKYSSMPTIQKAKSLECYVEGGQLIFTCKFCERTFLHCAALGGHVSKAHPGRSVSYLHKKRVRDTRELERELHQEAVNLYKEDHGDCRPE
jgi:hypothetical protein